MVIECPTVSIGVLLSIRCANRSSARAAALFDTTSSPLRSPGAAVSGSAAPMP
jgi:hypothetical protein